MIEQDYSNNDKLAAVYNKDYSQVVIVFPLVWKHWQGGDWFIKGNLLELKETFALGSGRY